MRAERAAGFFTASAGSNVQDMAEHQDKTTEQPDGAPKRVTPVELTGAMSFELGLRLVGSFGAMVVVMRSPF